MSLLDDYTDNQSTTGSLIIPNTANTPVSITGSIENYGDKDWFKVDLIAGNSYTFVTKDATDYTTNINLYDALGEKIDWLLSNNYEYNLQMNMASGVFTPKISGSYYVEITGNEISDYTLTAEQRNLIIADTPNTTTFIIGNLIDTDGWVAMNLIEGNSYIFKIYTTGYGDFPWIPYIYDSSGAVISYGGLAATITATTSNIYYLQFRDSGSSNDDYIITASQYRDDFADNATTTGYINQPTLNESTTATGVFEVSNDTDWFAVNLTAGNSYSFTVDSGYVIDSLTPKTSGVYYVAVADSAYGLSNTSYTYTLTANQYIDDYVDNNATIGHLDTPTIMKTTSTTGNFEVLGDSDWFAVNLIAGYGYSFTVNYSDKQPSDIAAPYIYDTFGVEVNFNYNFSNTLFIPEITGIYYISVTSGYSGTLGDYTVSAEINTVFSDSDYSLAKTNLENLTLTGTSAIKGIGNKLNNIITGNTSNNILNGAKGNDILSGGDSKDHLNGGEGNDFLNGGYGHDVLFGGDGNDTFLINSIQVTDSDKILDFNPIKDTIQLDYYIFINKLNYGVLDNSFFKIGTAASDANDYIIYNPTTGVLIYDQDGNGTAAGIKIAMLGINLSLTNSDFLVSQSF